MMMFVRMPVLCVMLAMSMFHRLPARDDKQRDCH